MRETSAKVEFGQAVYGDNGSGQTDLLARSGPHDSQLYTAADLPETLPVDYSPPPHYSVRRFGDLFAFFKTALDPEQRRAGMVRTHVLAAPVGSLVRASSIRPVLNALNPFTSLDDAGSGPVSLDLGAEQEEKAPRGGDALLAAVTTRYRRAGDPVVWVGLDSFPDALCYVWGVIPPAVRATLSVRLGMQAQNVYSADRSRETTRIIVVPHHLVGSWDAASVMGPQTPAPPAGPFLTYLQTEAGPLKRLLSSLGLSLEDTDAFSLLDRAAETYARLEADAISLDLDELLQLGELGTRLAPSLTADSEFRRRVGSALIEAAERDGGERIRNLRNFEAEGYEHGERVLSAAADGWAARAVFGEPRVGDAAVAGLAFRSQSETWNRAVSAALRARLSDPRSAARVVSWFDEQDDLSTTVGKLVPKTDMLEDAYAAVIDTEDLAEALEGWARSRHWAILYAQCLRQTQGADAALMVLAGMDKGRVSEALGTLLPHATSPAVVAVAVETLRPVLIDAAAERGADDPTLLTDLDLTKDGAQKVWLEAIEKRGEMSEVDLSLLDGLLEDVASDAIAPGLLGDLVDRSGLTLFDDARLGTLIDRLPRPARERVLAQTAAEWVRRFKEWASGDRDPFPTPDERTKRAVADTFSVPRVLPVASGLNALVELFESIPYYGERSFVRALHDLFPANRAPRRADALRLGRFVSKQKWKSAATVIRERAGYYPGYQVAYGEVESLFGALEHVLSFSWLTGSGKRARLDSDTWWNAFLELCVRNYPEGVQERNIVEEAGGDLSEMRLKDKTGKEQWRYVVSGLRQGAFGFDAGDLLRAMIYQLPNNTEVPSVLGLYNDYIA